MENYKKTKKDSKTILDFLAVLLKWRKVIVYNVGAVTIIALVISFMIPKWYSSTANLLPPKSSGGLLGDIGNISTTIKDLSQSLGRLGSVSDEAYNYLAILQSRTCAEKVIDKFTLREVYEFDEDAYIEDILRALDNNVEFNVEDEGNITIEVTDESPQRAADMAAYYIEVLNELSINMSTLEAKNNRIFIQKRYEQSMRDLKAVEDSLKKFSEQYSVYSIEEQTKAAIQAAAEIKARIEIEKIELDLLKKNYRATNPIIANKELMIREMKRRLKDMELAENFTETDVALYTPFSQLPEVGVKFLRVKAEYELQVKILEFVLPIYEQAKIQEQKDIPVTLVLDYPVPAERKAGPKKAIIVIAAFLISLLFSIVVVLMLEYLEKLREDEEKYKKINESIFIPLKKLFLFKLK